MPDRLKLTKNAQFFRIGEGVSNEMIQDVLDAATENVAPDGELIIDKFREEIHVEKIDLNFIYSIKAYPSYRPVYFLDDIYSDTIHAFILIIELGDYIAIFRKSCSSVFEVLENHFTLIGSGEFSSMFADENVEIQKLALRNMTVSDRAMRSRSYEAASLKGLLSTHSAGRSIPYYYKLRQGAVTKSISGTGRVVETSVREPLEEIGVWVKEQILQIESTNTSNFLDAFASKIELHEVLGVTAPNAILIECTSLFERIQKDNLGIKYKTKSGRIVGVKSRDVKKIESALEKVYEINSDYSVMGSHGRSKIRVNKKTLTLQSSLLSKLKLQENGKLVTLQKFIVKNGFYSISFDDPKYMYFMGSCFEDSSGVSEIDSILEMLTPVDGISNVSSEKGKPTSNSINFRKGSMFKLVESLHRSDDYIFCDDLGDEWADHITFSKKNSNICFIHSKHGDPSTSASNLHDVVGQGIKNLGNMYFDATTINAKVNAMLLSKYRLGGVQTNISRIRRGNAKRFEAYASNLLKDYKLNRSCVLSCSFISKSQVSREFEKIKNGQNVRGNVIQLLWILSSFAHAVKEMNVRPIIYCAE